MRAGGRFSFEWTYWCFEHKPKGRSHAYQEVFHVPDGTTVRRQPGDISRVGNGAEGLDHAEVRSPVGVFDVSEGSQEVQDSSEGVL